MNNEIQVRRAITQAKFNESASNWLFGEVFVVSIAIIIFTSSWILFGISFVGMLALLLTRRFAIVLMTIFSLLWAVVGGYIGFQLGGISAAIVIGIIVLILSGGLHSGALEWMDDMDKKKVHKLK